MKDEEVKIEEIEDSHTIGVYIREFVVYYESINREVYIKPIYECRCDGRLQTRDLRVSHTSVSVVYYESIKREPKIRGINKCRCDERLQTKTKEFTRLPYTGLECCFFLFMKR
jgi:hypothetical protein